MATDRLPPCRRPIGQSRSRSTVAAARMSAAKRRTEVPFGDIWRDACSGPIPVDLRALALFDDVGADSQLPPVALGVGDVAAHAAPVPANGWGHD